MNEALQTVTLVIAIGIGLTVPFILFILADMRARVTALSILIQNTSTNTATHSAQLAYMSDQISKLERKQNERR